MKARVLWYMSWDRDGRVRHRWYRDAEPERAPEDPGASRVPRGIVGQTDLFHDV